MKNVIFHFCGLDHLSVKLLMSMDDSFSALL